MLDKDVFFLFNDGSIRFTLAHEIMHYIFHKKRIYLEFLYHDGLSGLKCSNEMIDDVDTSEDLPLLEWQANRLAARVLAPKTTFIEKIEDLKTYYSSLGFSSFFPDIVEMLIEDLASFFGISKQATKIRLIDLGYDGAIEAFTFIDGHYVAPVGFSKGSLDRDESYSVGVKDLIIAKLFNPDLAKGFEEGKLIYVDHHVCLNEPKYLDKDSSGRTILSDYAKYTAQECLLKFTIKISGKYSRSSYCTLFREFGGIEANYTFSAEANKSAKAKADAILGRKREINALLNMVDESSFGNSLKSLMKHLNISNETMAEKLKVSVQTIKNYKSGETEQPKSNLAYALCLILDVPFIVCQKLLNTAGLSVPTGTNRGAIISFYMDNPGSSIKECNEQLKAIGEEPLIGDDDE